MAPASTTTPTTLKSLDPTRPLPGPTQPPDPFQAVTTHPSRYSALQRIGPCRSVDPG